MTDEKCYWCNTLLAQSEDDYKINPLKCRCKLDGAGGLKRLFGEESNKIEELLENKEGDNK